MPKKHSVPRKRTGASRKRRPTENRGSGLLVHLSVLLLLVAGSLMVYVWLHSEAESVARLLPGLRRDYAVAAKRAQNLKLELEEYKGGQHVLEAVDTLELGLTTHRLGQVFRMPPGTTIADTTPSAETVVARSDSPR